VWSYVEPGSSEDGYVGDRSRRDHTSRLVELPGERAGTIMPTGAADPLGDTIPPPELPWR